MALSGNILGDEIASNFYTEDMSQTEKDKIKAKWRIIANAITNHFDSNAELDTAVCNGATGTGGPVGPYPIVNQPVTGGIK